MHSHHESKEQKRTEISIKKYECGLTNLVYSQKLLIADSESQLFSVDMDDEEYKHLGSLSKFSACRRKMEMPDGRIMIESPQYSSITFDPVTGTSTVNDKNLRLEVFNHNAAINSEGILASGKSDLFNSRAVVRFYNMDLTKPFQTLQLEFRYWNITAVKDKFVISAISAIRGTYVKVGDVIIFQKNPKSGQFEQSYKLANLPSSNQKWVATAGPNKEILIVVDMTTGTERWISLWRENKEGKFDKPYKVEKIAIDNIFNFSTWNNRNNFALQTSPRNIYYSDLQLSTIESLDTEHDIDALVGPHAVHVVDEKLYKTTLMRYMPEDLKLSLLNSLPFSLDLIKMILQYCKPAAELTPLRQASIFQDKKGEEKRGQAITQRCLTSKTL